MAALPNQMRFGWPTQIRYAATVMVRMLPISLRRVSCALVPEHGAAAWTGDDGGESDRRLLRLLDRFDLTLHVLPASGVNIALTSCRLPVGDGEEQVSFVGKGFDPGDAVRRCLGEMAEFHSWLYDPAQDRTRVELDPPQPRLPGVVELLDCRDGWSRQDEAAIQARGWSRVERLTGAEPFSTWCPAQLCFGRYVAPDRAAPEAGLDNSGCAAGRSRDEALERRLAGGHRARCDWPVVAARHRPPGIDPRGIASVPPAARPRSRTAKRPAGNAGSSI